MSSGRETLKKKSKGFERFQLDPSIMRGLEAAGFTDPRPIQAETIPAGLSGLDVLGLAQTGTGKTAAFAIPIIDQILENPGKSIQALILAPTRELARQIDAEIRLLAKFTNIRTATVFGGVSIGGQTQALSRHPQIVVACPGRLVDLHNRRAINLSKVQTLVLDETDQMLDMGFMPDIRKIIATLPSDRQNMMFSATMPDEIRGLADAILSDPHVVELNHSQPAETITHELYPVDETKKLELLEHLMAEDGFRSAIVFMRTKYRAKRVADKLVNSGRRAVALQGNMTQGQRDRAMQGFRDGKSDILVATDIAARGIDVANVSHVVNFDVPDTPDAYTHRIGRTGRSERSGKAFTFITVHDRAIVRLIEDKLGEKIPRRMIDGLSVEVDRGAAPPPRPAGRGQRGEQPALRPGGGYGGGKRTGGNRTEESDRNSDGRRQDTRGSRRGEGRHQDSDDSPRSAGAGGGRRNNRSGAGAAAGKSANGSAQSRTRRTRRSA